MDNLSAVALALFLLLGQWQIGQRRFFAPPGTPGATQQPIITIIPGQAQTLEPGQPFTIE
ncbi:MAG: hypothetical protein ACRD8A_12595 [Candidatus Acidiferrales bacterium]